MKRRNAIGLGTAGIAAAGAGFAAGRFWPATSEAAALDPNAEAIAFYGAHQAGILTPAQDRLHFAAFEVITADRDELIALLQAWTVAAARMCGGDYAGPGGAAGGDYYAPPDDTGEAQGLPASGLTLTIGFGPTLFTDADGVDRFGIADRLPEALRELPPFALDALDPAVSGGDLCVQACANDPQVAVHAIRNLARIGFGTVSQRWSQLGFGRTSSTSTAQSTPRNLMGFKDGTANLKAEDGDLLEKHLWVGADDGADWLTGGSYLVTRRIRMRVETWDRTTLAEQEEIFGRDKSEGAPLGATGEFDEPDFEAEADGVPVIAAKAHIRLAHPTMNGDARMLRRGYSFVDGSDNLGRLDAGLFFIAYQRDPEAGFIPVQRSLSENDVLNEYIEHTSSAIFACPPGVRDEDDWWGRALFT
ncbi:iron uptake transporter deferrochelatase/peroxidase subunit [Glycomyces algeriensis]|uniref:Deferrochelatase n=1 Tax=Glycomyces algeriensis TaxID=256037 RepID=A0A9W6GC52_9ACTN|nr:iron uptake transporter deferrochelatase/peroxidase subunit [Glycomyces algeriensis]MDA1365670.1 iron uptake transporter deferrochelatase/peroxidase subunit [Glycomyces algeriensis]MDR7351358.1 deferrochelatase/peroxidase EfeB [Glycomyces algeriensis]GLI44073.1 peroxidase [Glycomyces algeriensis]